jgi:hypothetical protein
MNGGNCHCCRCEEACNENDGIATTQVKQFPEEEVGVLQSNRWERRTVAAKKKGAQKTKNVSARRISEKKGEETGQTICKR